MGRDREFVTLLDHFRKGWDGYKWAVLAEGADVVVVDEPLVERADESTGWFQHEDSFGLDLQGTSFRGHMDGCVNPSRDDVSEGHGKDFVPR